jgi:hypothetical protein
VDIGEKIAVATAVDVVVDAYAEEGLSQIARAPGISLSGGIWMPPIRAAAAKDAAPPRGRAARQLLGMGLLNRANSCSSSVPKASIRSFF